jgi:BlaI family transcriptional regulator, penicillinase repressor
MRRASSSLTDAELEIMHVVWRLGHATVRDVYETLRQSRKVAYTSVMTMMKILDQKGHLTKSRSDRAYVYEPAKPRVEVLGGMVRDFVDRVFHGAAKPLLVHLVEEKRLSREDVEEIRRLLWKSK